MTDTKYVPYIYFKVYLHAQCRNSDVIFDILYVYSGKYFVPSYYLRYLLHAPSVRNRVHAAVFVSRFYRGKAERGAKERKTNCPLDELMFVLFYSCHFYFSDHFCFSDRVCLVITFVLVSTFFTYFIGVFFVCSSTLVSFNAFVKV